MDATLNITYAGENADLPDLVSYELADADVREIAREALMGGVGDIPAIENPDVSGFVVTRIPANDTRNAQLILRPKTPFG